MKRGGRLRAAVLAAAAWAALTALTATGCQSQWYLQQEHEQVVRTEVLVRTDPTGATVWFDKTRIDTSPVVIPVEYAYTTEQGERQTNVGAQMREDLGIVGTILLFPIWIPASFFHTRDEMKRHVYGSNRHVISARTDAAQAEQTIELAGETRVEVTIALPRTVIR